jgi:hypothetical protein
MLEFASTSRVCRDSAAGQICVRFAAASASAGETMIIFTVTLLCITGFVAGEHAPRTGAAVCATGAMNASLLVVHAQLPANHPIRIVGPLVPMVAAYMDMLSPNCARAYSIARLVFSLAFAAEFASLCFVLWGEWPLPLVSVAVCLGIVAHAIAPRKVLKWLPF